MPGRSIPSYSLVKPPAAVLTRTRLGERLGMEVVGVETERMRGAADVASSVSFNDRLCLVVRREEGWPCVTNDGALRRLCERHGVETRFASASWWTWSSPALSSGDAP